MSNFRVDTASHTHSVRATEVRVECGGLVFLDDQGRIVVAFAPGCWSSFFKKAD